MVSLMYYLVHSTARLRGLACARSVSTRRLASLHLATAEPSRRRDRKRTSGNCSN